MTLFPNPILDDQQDKAWIDAELFGYLRTSYDPVNVHGANFSDFFPVKLGEVIGGAKVNRRVFCHTLFSGVGIVSSACVQKQMSRIHASPVVPSGAIMANTQPFRYWASCQNPSGTVGHYCFAVPVLTNAAVPINKARRPNPATKRAARFINLVPKAFWESWRKSLRGEVFRCYGELLNLHKILGHALGCSFTARAFSL